MGGQGKTTLAQLIYNDSRIKQHFGLTIWVCVSDDFGITKLLTAIIEVIEDGRCDLQELESLQLRLRGKLSKKKFLLVLDDVWNEDATKWDVLRILLSCGEKGSTVIVTTRIEKIARFMASTNMHRLESLSEADSWSLFKRASGLHEMEEYMHTIGKEILIKCCGVPLAIKTLGSLMCAKNGEDEWRSVLESEFWDLQDDESSIRSALMLSYQQLAPHLRQCFNYCCIFCKDYRMEKDKLIQQWMANGFIPHKELRQLYDIGEDIFNELAWRSFIHEVTEHPFEDGVITFKIHDLMHDLASSMSKGEIFNTNNKGGIKITGVVRHLCFGEPDGHPEKRLIPPESKLLRSVILQWNPIDVPTILSRLNHVRVLDMEKCSMNRLPSSISKLKHLRYLKLSGSEIITLPKSIIYLQNLQTLILFWCRKLYELPKDMKQMKELSNAAKARRSHPSKSKLYFLILLVFMV